MDNNLLIGIIESDQHFDHKSNELISFRTNKIGGSPLLSPKSSPHIIDSFNSLVCDLCQKQLTFVLQIYCPIDDSMSDRVLYLFICINTNCHQMKWFAIRSVTPYLETSEPKQTINQNSVWVEGESDWGQTSDQIMDGVSDCDQSLANLSINSDSSLENESIIVNTSGYFPTFYISVIEEPIDTIKDDKHINQLMESYKTNNESQNCGQSSDNSKESYEQNSLNTIYRNDRKNYEFFKRLSVCQKQVIRYQWTGNPLINSDSHKPVVSMCESCGAERCFELQLMPALICYLNRLSSLDTSVDIDFGTVLIYCCSNNCLKSDSLTFEQIVVLSDPDNQFIDKINKILK